MAITRTAKGIAGTASGTTVSIASVALTAGDLLVVGLLLKNGSTGTTPPAPDSIVWGSQTLSLDGDHDDLGGGIRAQMYSCVVASSGTATITATWTTAPTRGKIMWAVSVTDVATKDQTAGNDNGNGSSSWTAGPVTTTEADEIILVALVRTRNYLDTLTASDSFVAGQRSSLSTMTSYEFYRIVSAIGTYSTAQNNSVSSPYCSVMVSYKASGGGGRAWSQAVMVG